MFWGYLASLVNLHAYVSYQIFNHKILSSKYFTLNSDCFCTSDQCLSTSGSSFLCVHAYMVSTCGHPSAISLYCLRPWRPPVQPGSPFVDTLFPWFHCIMTKPTTLKCPFHIWLMSVMGTLKRGSITCPCILPRCGGPLSLCIGI